MLEATQRGLFALAAALALGTAVPAAAEGPVLLTVTGDIDDPNRGPVDPDVDKLFLFNDVSFDEAREFDIDDAREAAADDRARRLPQGRRARPSSAGRC